MSTKTLNNSLAIIALISAFFTVGIFFVKEGDKTKISSMQAMVTNQTEKAHIVQEEKKILETQMFVAPPEESKQLGTIKIHLPETANVFVNGKATYSKGNFRVFESELVVGKNYDFKVVVSYESGVSEARNVVLTGGQVVTLNFSK